MENFLVILLGIAGLIISIYTKSKKAEQKRKETTPKPRTVFETIFSEIEIKSEIKTKSEVKTEKRNKEKIEEKAQVLSVKREEEVQTPLQEEIKIFNLRDAVIHSAILNKQYN